MRNSVVAIVGPTGVGKTKISIVLAKSVRKFNLFCMKNAEIICCDSRQIYKDMDIVTAKPTPEEVSEIRHHLYDFISPADNNFSVANYVELAKNKTDELLAEEKLPIIVGGTGLYFRSLLGDFDIPRVPPNKEFRAEMDKLSSEELFEILKEKDFKLAQKIHPNNKPKIIRALEVMDALKIPMSEAQKKKPSPYNVIWVGLDAKNRDFLYERINQRCDLMLSTTQNNGLLDELKTVLKKYGELELFNSTIGYGEFLPYLKGEISYDEAISKFKQHTRNYAKRQLSWFRHDEKINWFYIDEMNDDQILEGIIKLCS